jgi:hypothetical protein
MKKFFFALVLLVGCRGTDQEVAKEVTDEIIYMQDVRTGLCYAYYWGGSAHGGPALTVVPCESCKAYLVNKAE